MKKRKLTVVDVRSGETEDQALQRAEGKPMPVDDLEIEEKPGKMSLQNLAAAAGDLASFVQKGMKASEAVAEVMKNHGVKPVPGDRGPDGPVIISSKTSSKFVPPKQELVDAQLVDADGPGPYRVIPVDHISESPTNPRKDFGNMDELVNSIRTHGVLTPLLVAPSAEEGKPFRLVYGHRRLRAARKAGLKDVPTIVRVGMSEAQVLEAQLVENVQRSDIHPMDEAEGYERLHKQFSYTVDQIAAKVGKSKGWVYARMKMTELTPESRAAFHKGVFPASVATMVARIPADFQAKAVAGLTPPADADPMSVRQAAEYLQANFMLRLGDAPFDKDDEFLIAEAGTCKACPKRSGNNRELFGDVSGADLCTDPGCYQSKVSAFWQGQADKAQAKGHKVLSKAEGAKLYRSGKLQFDADFVEQNGPCPEDEKRRTWKKLCEWAGTTPQVWIAGDPNGFPHPLFKRDDPAVVEALKQLGGKRKATEERASALEPKPVVSDEDKAKLKQERNQREVRRVVQQMTVTQVVEHVQKKGADAHALRLMAFGLIHMVKPEATLERRGMTEAQLEKAVPKMDAKQLLGLVFELCTSEWIGDSWVGYSPEFKSLAKVFDVDTKKLEKEATAQVELGLGKKPKAKA